MRILDLYCGQGGLSFGFATAFKGSTILGLDWDRDAVSTYNLNLSRYGARAEQVNLLEWQPKGNFDVIIAGPPCQAFSLAVNPKTGKIGEGHPAFPTFPRFFDIVLELQPKVFLLENVRGLVSKRHRWVLEQQLDRLAGRYVVAWKVLNAAFYGVPQSRERVFVVGVRRDLNVTFSFPSPTHAPEEHVDLTGRKVHRWVSMLEAIGDLLQIPPIGYPKKLIQTNPNHGKPADLDKPSRTIKVDGRGGDFTFDTILVPLSTVTLPLTPEQLERIMSERLNDKRHWSTMPFPDPLDKPSRTISSATLEGSKRETIVIPYHVMLPKGGWTENSDWGTRVMKLDKPSYTITEKHRAGQLVPSALGYRRLTVREVLRLQGFPDWWTYPEGVSISKMYKLTGEAVPTILAHRLARLVAEILGVEPHPPSPEDFALPYFARAFPDILPSEQTTQRSSQR